MHVQVGRVVVRMHIRRKGWWRIYRPVSIGQQQQRASRAANGYCVSWQTNHRGACKITRHAAPRGNARATVCNYIVHAKYQVGHLDTIASEQTPAPSPSPTRCLRRRPTTTTTTSFHCCRMYVRLSVVRLVGRTDDICKCLALCLLFMCVYLYMRHVMRYARRLGIG